MAKRLPLLLAAAALALGCAGAADAPEQQQPSGGACSAYGEAPDVTTIRTPVNAASPHPDCIAQDELSPAGQRVYCCMGAAFDAWYKSVGQ